MNSSFPFIHPFKELTLPSEPESLTIGDRLVLVSRKLKGSLDDPKKQKRLKKLLQELESLAEN